jgi:citryl-CoA lyase
MKFTTAISETGEAGHRIYGEPMTALLAQHTFTEVIFLLYAKRLPTAGERLLLDTVLVASAEHGIEAPSLYVPRISVSSGNPVHVGIAAGILAIGEVHGGAGRAAAELLEREEDPSTLVAEYAEAKKHMPGFGHRTYKEEDPRARIIYETAKTVGLPLFAFERAYAIEALLAQEVGKKLPFNIDGACAAAVLALSMPPEAAEALFVVGRVAGMGAHAIEERSQKGGYHRLESEDVTR